MGLEYKESACKPRQLAAGWIGIQSAKASGVGHQLVDEALFLLNVAMDDQQPNWLDIRIAQSINAWAH